MLLVYTITSDIVPVKKRLANEEDSETRLAPVRVRLIGDVIRWYEL